MKKILCSIISVIFFYINYILFIHCYIGEGSVSIYHLMNVIACNLRNQITFQTSIFHIRNAI